LYRQISANNSFTSDVESRLSGNVDSCDTGIFTVQDHATVPAKLELLKAMNICDILNPSFQGIAGDIYVTRFPIYLGTDVSLQRLHTYHSLKILAIFI
jgi:hypothetical protein